MQKWEYLIVPLEDAKRLKTSSGALPPSELNNLGAQGWEAVGSRSSRATWSPGQ